MAFIIQILLGLHDHDLHVLGLHKSPVQKGVRLGIISEEMKIIASPDCKHNVVLFDSDVNEIVVLVPEQDL